MQTSTLFLLLAAILCIVSTARSETVTALIYADNYFEFYFNGSLVKTDPLDFTPHNAVKFTFEANGYPRTYAIKAKDFATSSGFEYTQTATPQLGDGALRLIFSDGTVSNKAWKCFTTSFGPTDASIAAGCNSKNLSPCLLKYTDEPANWTLPSFDDSTWAHAAEFTEAQAGWGMAPTYSNGLCSKLTDPYTRADKNPSAVATSADECLSPRQQSWGKSSFIWQPDLERDNTILCRITVTASDSSKTASFTLMNLVLLAAVLLAFM